MVVITLIQQQHLMAGSDRAMGFGENTSSVTGMDSRGGSDWDDEY